MRYSSVCRKISATLTEMMIWYALYSSFSRSSAGDDPPSSVPPPPASPGDLAITSMTHRREKETTTSTSEAYASWPTPILDGMRFALRTCFWWRMSEKKEISKSIQAISIGLHSDMSGMP